MVNLNDYTTSAAFSDQFLDVLIGQNGLPSDFDTALANAKEEIYAALAGSTTGNMNGGILRFGVNGKYIFQSVSLAATATDPEWDEASWPVAFPNAIMGCWANNPVKNRVAWATALGTREKAQGKLYLYSGSLQAGTIIVYGIGY